MKRITIQDIKDAVYGKAKRYDDCTKEWQDIADEWTNTHVTYDEIDASTIVPATIHTVAAGITGPSGPKGPVGNWQWQTVRSSVGLDDYFYPTTTVNVEGKEFRIPNKEMKAIATEYKRIEVLAEEFPAVKQALEKLQAVVKLHQDGK